MNRQLAQPAVYAPDPVFDIARAITVAWRHNPRPEQLLALIDHFDGDRVLPRTAEDSSELEVTCLFLRLAGAAVAIDPKALLITAPDGSGLDTAVGAAARWLLDQVADAPQMLVARPASEHAAPTRTRLEDTKIVAPVATAETQSAVWSALTGAARVAATTEACRQAWTGPHQELLAGVAADVAAATIAVFCPPWATPAVAAHPGPGAPARVEGAGVGLAYLLESGLTASNPWAHQWAIEQLAAAAASTGPDHFLGHDIVWAAELAMVADSIVDLHAGLASQLRAMLAAGTRLGPVAYFAACNPARGSAQMSAWTEAALAAH